MKLTKDPNVLFTKEDWHNFYIVWIPYHNVYEYMKYVDGKECIVAIEIREDILEDTDFITVDPNIVKKRKKK
jgi:hypothetical protein